MKQFEWCIRIQSFPNGSFDQLATEIVQFPYKKTLLPVWKTLVSHAKKMHNAADAIWKPFINFQQSPTSNNNI